VVAFDMPGMGHASDPLEGPYTTDGAAAFIDHVLARLGIKHVHLVLHDFGGPWGLQWGAAHGDLLSSVVLIDTGVLINYVGHPAAIVWHTPVTGEVSMATLTRDSFKADLQAENPKPFPSQFLDRMYDDYDRYTRCAVLSYYRSIANPDTLGREQAAALSNRRRPALVVWGEDDVYLPPQLLADEQKQAFPDAEIHILPGDGHWPFIDDPQRVRDLVEPFLSKWVHAPRLLAAHGPLRAGRTKPFRVDLHAEGVPVARRVDVGLYRGGARVGGLRRALSVHGRSRRPRVHLRRRLTSGRYTLRLSAPDWPVQAFPLTVR